MTKRTYLLPLLLAASLLLANAGWTQRRPARLGKASAAMLPSRLLECQLGRITNVDPTKERLPTVLEFEGRHPIKLFLPSIPVRTKEPPRSTLSPEPVDPRTRLIDPDGIGAGAAGHRFERVVDYWPERVEMTTPVGKGQVTLIVLQPSEGRSGSTDIFLTQARDAVTYDKDHMYSGRCETKLGADALAPSAG